MEACRNNGLAARRDHRVLDGGNVVAGRARASPRGENCVGVDLLDAQRLKQAVTIVVMVSSVFTLFAGGAVAAAVTSGAEDMIIYLRP